MKMVQRVLIVGSGLTGTLTANILRKQCPELSVTVWDKARGVGGRMTTSKSPNNPTCIADLGAQYITTSNAKLKQNSFFYEPLFNSKLIVPANFNMEGMKTYPNDVHHFVAPQGMSSILKYFIADGLNENVLFEHQINHIVSSKNSLKISLTNNKSEEFDVVILTIPVPQILALKGIETLCPMKIIQDLNKVKYSSRFAVLLFYNSSFTLPEWSGKYLDHDIFRYVSIENVKRQRESEPVSIVFHTSVQFGLNNIEKTVQEMHDPLLLAIREMFPSWPEPDFVKTHKWRYSQVQEPYPGSPGAVILNENPLLVAGGDGFSESNIDGCIHSALSLIDIVKNKMNA